MSPLSLHSQRIQELNDAFRTTFVGGQVNLTRGLAALHTETQERIISAVREFKGFNRDNDPCGEHDYGTFTINGHQGWWKIDYYENGLHFGSPNPADPSVTVRVLTIGLVSDY